MLPQKQAEEAIVSNFNETDPEGKEEQQPIEDDQSIFNVKNLLWHGGSAWDAWFSCSSNQVRRAYSFLFIYLLFLYPLTL